MQLVAGAAWRRLPRRVCECSGVRQVDCVVCVVKSTAREVAVCNAVACACARAGITARAAAQPRVHKKNGGLKVQTE